MATNPYASMQAMIRDQTAAAQAMREAAISIKNASDMIAITMGENFNTNRPPPPGGGGGGGGGGNGGDPNGGRPRMNQNQTYRPVHTPGNIYGSRGRGITGVRSMVANQLQGRVGVKSGATYESIHNREGQKVGYRETLPDGTQRVRDLEDPTIDQDIAAAGTRQLRSNVIGGFGAIGARAGIRAVPYVGAAFLAAEGINDAITKVGEERQANAQYQSIFGGGNFTTGYSNRLQGTGFRLSQRFSGGMTGEQSTEAFRGVSALGYQGEQRSSSLNFISSNYKSMGMDVASSLKLISDAAKSLNGDLTGLKDGLKGVSDVAKLTGQNAATARQAFGRAYSQISATNPGVGAAGIAGAVSSMSTGLGRSMQGLDFTSQFTTQGGVAQLAPLAGGLGGRGMTMSQLRGSMMSGSDTALRASDTLMAQITAQFLTANVRAIIDQAVSQIPGGKATLKANPDLVAQQITPKVLQVVNADAVKAAFGRIASLSTMTPDQAVTLLIDTYLGLAGNLTQQRQDMLKSKQQDLTKIDWGGLAPSGIATGPRGGRNKGVDPVVDDARTALKGKNVIVNSEGGQRVVSIDVAANNYTDQVAKGTALVAETGQSVRDALGGAYETNYVGPDTSKYHASKGQTTKKSGLNTDRGMSVEAFNAMQAEKNAKAAGGTVTIAPSKELAQLLSFSATGNVAIATTGAATGTVPVPGS